MYLFASPVLYHGKISVTNLPPMIGKEAKIALVGGQQDGNKPNISNSK